MIFDVQLSAAAQIDLRQSADWWAEHRSPSQAERWYVSIIEKIYSLDHMPGRCPLAIEAASLGEPIHCLLFGVSAKATHRVLFMIDSDVVSVLRVLSTRQAALQHLDELH